MAHAWERPALSMPAKRNPAGKMPALPGKMRNVTA